MKAIRAIKPRGSIVMGPFMDVDPWRIARGMRDNARGKAWYPSTGIWSPRAVWMHGSMVFSIINVGIGDLYLPLIVSRHPLSEAEVLLGRDDGLYIYEAEYSPSYYSIAAEAPGFQVWGSRPSPKRVEALGASSTHVVARLYEDGQTLIAKSYRLVTGDNPEPLLLGELGRRGYRHAPRLKAVYELPAWGYAVTIVEEDVGIGAGLAGILRSNARRYLDGEECLGEAERLMRMLGHAVALMHRTLSESYHPLIMPEPISRGDLDFWRQIVSSRLRALKNIIPGDEYARLIGLARKASAVLPLMHGKLKMLTHQDLHLDQVLLAGETLYLVDFEGEPAAGRSRLLKLPAVRDLACIRRSLDYIVAEESPENPEALLEWRDKLFSVLLESYIDGLGNWSEYVLGVSPDSLEAWIDKVLVFWTLERGLYEALYEYRYTGSMERARIPLKTLLHEGRGP